MPECQSVLVSARTIVVSLKAQGLGFTILSYAILYYMLYRTML